MDKDNCRGGVRTVDIHNRADSNRKMVMGFNADNDIRYGWCKELSAVCGSLLEYEMTQDEIKFVRDFASHGRDNGYVSLGQMRELGRLSKHYIQCGEYIHHNWWNGSFDFGDMAKTVRFYRSQTEAIPGGEPTATEFRRRFNKKMRELSVKYGDEIESMRFSNVEDECS